MTSGHAALVRLFANTVRAALLKDLFHVTNVIRLQSEQSRHLTEEKGHLGLCVRLTV